MVFPRPYLILVTVLILDFRRWLCVAALFEEIVETLSEERA